MNINSNPVHFDARGAIKMILESCNVGSISRIESYPDSKRASHFHTHGEGHWIIVNEGKIELYEQPVNDITKVPVTKIVLNKGDIHFTGEYIRHEMRFDCFTVFDCFSIHKRTEDSYEKNTVRFDYSLKDLYEQQSK